MSTHQLQLGLKSGGTRNCAKPSQPFAQAFLQAFAHKHAAVESAYLRATKDGWREPLSLLMLAHRAGSCRHLPVGADGKPRCPKDDASSSERCPERGLAQMLTGVMLPSQGLNVWTDAQTAPASSVSEATLQTQTQTHTSAGLLCSNCTPSAVLTVLQQQDSRPQVKFETGGKQLVFGVGNGRLCCTVCCCLSVKK